MSRRVEIRVFAADDRAAVESLWTSAFPDDRAWNQPAAIIDRKLATQPSLFWVGSLDGRVVAAVMAGWDGQRGWIYHLAVSPEQRRSGIGRAMMATAEAALEALGCPKVNLQVQASNTDVVGFYEELGYAVEERISMGKTLA